MKLIRLLLAASALLLLPGCIPQWRVFQKEMPAPMQKSNAQVEAERRAADFLARRIETPKSLIPVADKLSESLGRPDKPIVEKDTPKAAAASEAELQKEINKWKEKYEKQQGVLKKYQGQKIEDTGINLFGGSVVLSIGAFVAAIILIPGFGAFVLWAVGRLRKASVQMINGVEGFATENPKAGKELKEWLSSQMDEAQKQIVATYKDKYLDRSNIEEILKAKSEEPKA